MEQFNSHDGFVWAMRERPDITDGEGHRIDPERAWTVYSADPQHWHRVTQDNPSGDPFAGLAGEDGRYWVTDERLEIHTDVSNPSTGSWECIEVDHNLTREDFADAEVSARDIGGEPGEPLRLRLIDPEIDGDAGVLDTREIEAS